jgi:hypothetical protein
VENLLVVIGMLFFAFLVLAAAVESILEAFRGVLAACGISLLQPKLSLEDVLAQADEFVPATSDLRNRAAALVVAADQLRAGLKDKIEKLEYVRGRLADAGEPFNEPGLMLTRLASAIRSELETRERVRVFILRVLACGIGCGLVALTDFHVLTIIGKAEEAKPFVGGIKHLNTPWVNVVLGGLAAAAGSSYWHDQLDRIRNVKAAVAGLKDVVAAPLVAKGAEASK